MGTNDVRYLGEGLHSGTDETCNILLFSLVLLGWKLRLIKQYHYRTRVIL